MRSFFGFIILVSLCGCFAGCSSSDEAAKGNMTQVIRSSSKPVQQELPETQVIRRGDRIQVSVWGYPEFNFSDSVKDNGAIMIPLLGEMNVLGTTKEEFTSELSKKLAEYIQGEIKLVVTLTGTKSKLITMLGAVMRPEHIPYSADMSLLDALALAGGAAPEADLRHVRILRGGPNTLPIEVDILSFVEHGNVDTVPIMRAGDTVFVPKEEDLIKEMGMYLGSAVFLFSFFVLLQ